jgi:hypothetical protein
VKVFSLSPVEKHLEKLILAGGRSFITVARALFALQKLHAIPTVAEAVIDQERTAHIFHNHALSSLLR